MISLFSQLFFVSSRAQRLECWVTTQRTPRMHNKLGFEILIKVAVKTSANFLAFLRILRVRDEYFSVKIFVSYLIAKSTAIVFTGKNIDAKKPAS